MSEFLCDCGAVATHELAFVVRKRVGEHIATFSKAFPLTGSYCEVCAEREVADGIRFDDAAWNNLGFDEEIGKTGKMIPDRELTLLVKKPAGWHASTHQA
jgi:hypothetical protein